MQQDNIKRYKSWFVSAGIVVLVTLWIASGSLGNSEEGDAASDATVAAPSKNGVRVRTQSAEEVMRTIVVNGKTAPARIAQLSAETDGRIEFIGAERGASLERGKLIVRMDQRDRAARLAQAEATVKQREVEYEARERLKSESYVSEAQLQEALALLESARAELTRAQLDLEYMSVHAPFAGALQARVVEIGDFVKRGDPIEPSLITARSSSALIYLNLMPDLWMSAIPPKPTSPLVRPSVGVSATSPRLLTRRRGHSSSSSRSPTLTVSYELAVPPSYEFQRRKFSHIVYLRRC